jgi:hypothetical protein
VGVLDLEGTQYASAEMNSGAKRLFEDSEKLRKRPPNGRNRLQEKRQ